MTNCHAHIEVDILNHHFDKRYEGFRLRFEDVIPELREYRAVGGFAICELTPMGLGRNPTRTLQVSKETEVMIVLGTGIYHEIFHPHEIVRMKSDQITEMFLRDINIGIENTGVKAGIIGELGTYTYEISKREKTVFIAAAQAAIESGLAISTHTHAGELAREQAVFLLSLGVKPKKIIIGHLDDKFPLRGEESLMRDLLSLGVWIQFDDIGFDYFSPTLGVQMPTDKARIELLSHLISDGFGDQILLGSDICKGSHLKAQGGPGFSHFAGSFYDAALQFGISEGAMKIMLIDNPVVALSF